MSTKIHWFNPENDLALATGSPIYTPKRAAQWLHNAGSVLPLWYADDQDQVLCYGVNAKWLERIRREFGIEADIFDHKPMPGQEPDPWGWSAYAKRYFLDEGFDPDCMPSDARIAQMRELSHRRTSIAVTEMIHKLLPDIKLAEAATELSSMEQVKHWMAEHERAYIKFPWSSSGRGVFDIASAPIDNILKLAEDSIRRQGSVMLEPAYERVADFARLYECRDGRCQTVGTSVFTTDEHDSYVGNVLGSEEYLLSILSQKTDREQLTSVFEAQRIAIESIIAPKYDGILGVDMLISADGTIDAVVEINLRKTMGYVARRFADRYMHPDAHGIFSVLPTAATEATCSNYEVADGRMLSGTLMLTPYNPHFTLSVRI